jgi:hypothetical protein
MASQQVCHKQLVGVAHGHPYRTSSCLFLSPPLCPVDVLASELRILFLFACVLTQAEWYFGTRICQSWRVSSRQRTIRLLFLFLHILLLLLLLLLLQLYAIDCICGAATSSIIRTNLGFSLLSLSASLPVPYLDMLSCSCYLLNTWDMSCSVSCSKVQSWPDDLRHTRTHARITHAHTWAPQSETFVH